MKRKTLFALALVAMLGLGVPSDADQLVVDIPPAPVGVYSAVGVVQVVEHYDSGMVVVELGQFGGTLRARCVADDECAGARLGRSVFVRGTIYDDGSRDIWRLAGALVVDTPTR